jgi:lipopolysaccharide transport system permease protein
MRGFHGSGFSASERCVSDRTVVAQRATSSRPAAGRAAAASAVPARRAAPLILRPTSGWAALRVGEVWQFRDLMFSLAGRDLKLRYKQTLMGAAWVVLQPLAAAGIFNFVFGIIAGMQTSFAATFAGVTAWNLFANTLTRASGCLVGNANLISKVYFPRLVLPFAAVPSSLVDFAVAMGMMAVLLVMRGVPPGWELLLLPAWMALLLMLALGVGLVAASLMVSYRDVVHFLPVAVQLLMFASPVAYSAGGVPQHWQRWYHLNPLSPLLEGFRWSMLGEGRVQWGFAAYAAAAAALALLLGILAFKRMERKFADVI